MCIRSQLRRKYPSTKPQNFQGNGEYELHVAVEIMYSSVKVALGNSTLDQFGI